MADDIIKIEYFSGASLEEALTNTTSSLNSKDVDGKDWLGFQVLPTATGYTVIVAHKKKY